MTRWSNRLAVRYSTHYRRRSLSRKLVGTISRIFRCHRNNRLSVCGRKRDINPLVARFHDVASLRIKRCIDAAHASISLTHESVCLCVSADILNATHTHTCAQGADSHTNVGDYKVVQVHRVNGSSELIHAGW